MDFATEHHPLKVKQTSQAGYSSNKPNWYADFRTMNIHELISNDE